MIVHATLSISSLEFPGLLISLSAIPITDLGMHNYLRLKQCDYVQFLVIIFLRDQFLSV